MTGKSKVLIAAGVFGVALFAASASAAEYAVVNLNTSVDAPVDVVWKKVGGYCDISAWLKLPCVITSGSGDVGTVRRLADRIDEVMVGRTAHSYTYTQPNTTILYHGTLEVVPDGKNHSKILYNLIWDQAALTSDDAKAKDRDQRTKNFTAALANMKALAEAK
ncbi:MAG TPA: SRPBCC family protein [Steroidobacteraceae bacterium]|jgi:hypothetical protein|nr:SRPBCC family protein [Steroidobacteraceae bacterium]